MTIDHHRAFLKRCIESATRSAGTDGGPFAALVVRDNAIIGEGCNRVTHLCDPTAHAEVMAIRSAAASAGSPHLEGATLYTSCEPCPLCLSAALWSHIGQIVYAAPHAEAVRAGFDDTRFACWLYGQPQPVNPPRGLLLHVPLPEASAPFDTWLANTQRQPY